MAIYHVNEDAIAVGIESTSGQPASLTLEGHALLCESASMEPSGAGTVDRKNFPRGDLAELRPVPAGTNGYTVNIVVPAHFVSAAVDVGTDTDWDDRRTDALLRACGLAQAKAAGTRTYTAAAGSAMESCTIERTHGPLWMQSPGCVGNVVWSGQGGEASKLTFSMSGVYRPAESGDIAGTTWTDDLLSPPAVDRMTLAIGSWLTPCVSSFSWDLGNEVQPQVCIALYPESVYHCATHDESAGAPMTNETTDINDTDAGDVIVFRSATLGTNVDDAIYFGARHQFNGVKLVLGTAGAGDYTVTWEYYNGSSWATLGMGKQEVTHFRETAGTYFNLWAPPTAWASTTVNSVTGYFVRARVSAYTSYTTQPLLTQAWLLFERYNMAKSVITSRAPRLTLSVELEATATYNPEDDMRDETARTIVLTVGTADNNTFQLTLTNAYVAAVPKKTTENGIARYEVVYSLGGTSSSFSWLWT